MNKLGWIINYRLINTCENSQVASHHRNVRFAELEMYTVTNMSRSSVAIVVDFVVVVLVVVVVVQVTFSLSQ